jgi:hypothetical protein
MKGEMGEVYSRDRKEKINSQFQSENVKKGVQFVDLDLNRK